MRLNMWNPTTENLETYLKIKPYGFDGYEYWLENLVSAFPNFLYFYTVDSTDIWDDAINETHSCSCHVRNQGPCPVCKGLGCKVWNYNQVAVHH